MSGLNDGVTLFDARRQPLVCTLAVVALQLLAGCGAATPPVDWLAVDTLIADRFPETPSITTAELAEMLAERSTPVLLVDARAPEEFDVSHLHGARNLESAEAVEDWIAGHDASARVVVYCSVGYRSAALVAELHDRGMTNAVNLQGSIFAWANEGRPVYRGGDRVDAVHPFDPSWGALLDRPFWPAGWPQQ